MAALQKDNSNPGDFHINMFSTNGISRSKFQYKVYLCKTFEYAALHWFLKIVVKMGLPLKICGFSLRDI